MENTIKVTLSMEKNCNNVVKFTESVGKFAPYKIGNLYINKMILAENKYTGKPITVSISKADKNTDEDAIILMPEIPEDGKLTNSIKFNEVLPNEFVPAVIGKLSLSKFTLAEIEYAGEPIVIDISFED